ncbi:hypothetical protein OG723_39925 [Streptomyces sp. NBC_01278]|uniref:hypothetical protein n=1 Tax=Streptomyces sp. NBC_01278 TaxID=2903809 RepID=UPI002E2F2D85|nr:hypothetical protein [Streptomyces sp. NBC_01278]
MIDGLWSLDDARITRVLGRSGGKPEMLGFGLGETVALVTPVVWLVVDEVASRGAGLAAEGLLTRMRSAVRRLLPLRRAQGEPQVVPPLSPEQLDIVYRRVLERAAEAGIGRQRAQTLADAVVSRLAREPGA